MKISLEPGKYVVAVSGGVDSVALLSMLSRQQNLELVVAHFDHGIRDESHKDKKFVEYLAKKYDLEFACETAELGSDASEELARRHRYDFLKKVRAQTESKAIVTAHHQDDVIETAIINLLRGTKRKGLSSLKSSDSIKRPLLGVSKQQIIDYAKKNNLGWREDVSNKSAKYLRNRIRYRLDAQLTKEERKKVLAQLNNINDLNKQIDQIIDEYAGLDSETLNTNQLNSLPHSVSKDLLAEWLRRKEVSFDSRMIERVVVAIKTKKPGTKIDLDSKHYLLVEKGEVGIKPRTSV